MLGSIVFSLRSLSNCNNDGHFNPNMVKLDINTSGQAVNYRNA